MVSKLSKTNCVYSRELPHVDCVPSSELNQTVELYKLLVKLLPNPKSCMEEHTMMPRSKVEILMGNAKTSLEFDFPRLCCSFLRLLVWTWES